MHMLEKNVKQCTKQISLTPATDSSAQRLAAPVSVFLHFFPERICASRNLNISPSCFVFTHLVARSTTSCPTSCFSPSLCVEGHFIPPCSDVVQHFTVWMSHSQFTLFFVLYYYKQDCSDSMCTL